MISSEKVGTKNRKARGRFDIPFKSTNTTSSRGFGHLLWVPSVYETESFSFSFHQFPFHAPSWKFTGSVVFILSFAKLVFSIQPFIRSRALGPCGGVFPVDSRFSRFSGPIWFKWETSHWKYLVLYVCRSWRRLKGSFGARANRLTHTEKDTLTNFFWL